MTDLIETILVLFWAGYMLLNAYLLRTPVNETAEDNAALPGEPLCTTPATK